MRTMTRGVVLAAGLCLSLSGCSSKPTTTDQKPKEGPDQSAVGTTGAAGQQALPKATLASFQPLKLDDPTTMEVRLSDGSPLSGGAVAAMTRAKTTDLDAQTTAQLLGRLQPLVAKQGDVKDFAKRADSKPPPRTGTTVKTPFPPESDKARPDAVKADPSAPVKVLRHAPDGDVPIVPQLSVTFDQPMVALTSHADTIAKGVPVQVEPALPEGQWRWVGAKTLLFDPKAKRLPMATTYKVTIPAGTRSANGQTLGEAATWSFQTPPLSLKTSFPRYGQHERDQLIFLAFNQQIKPDQVLEHISIKSSGVLWGKEQAAVQATAEDVAGDPEIKNLVEAAEPGTWIVVKAAQPLPYDKTVTVTIKKGAPSAEGPRTTTQDMAFNFRTYGELKLVRHRCGWGGRCRPTDGFSLQFSNPLDAEKFDPKLVKVEPGFATASISQSGNFITVGGIKPGRRSYSVTVDKSLTDRFGQKLDKDVTVKFDVGAADPSMYSNAGEFTILDASSAPVFSVFSLNYKSLRVKAWAVQPSDWEAYQEYRANYRYYGQQKPVAPPGKQVMNEVITVTGKPDELAQTGIALKKALGGKAQGHIVLEIEPEAVTEGSTMPRYKPSIRTWIQATTIALDGFIDHGEFIGWATSLKDGEPIEGVTMTLGASGATATTDRTGIARIPLPEYAKAKGADYLLGAKGGDMAMLPESFYYYKNRTSSWHKRTQSDTLRWYVFDDRAMYKPSEEVHLKGWLRVLEYREGGGIRLLDAGKKITYRVVGPRGNEITKGETVTTSLGGFDLKFTLPDTPNLGHAHVELRAPDAGVGGGYHNHAFQIQEFRTPEFEVSTSTSEGPFLAGEDAQVTVKGKYYAGGGLPGAPATWSVQTTPTSYRPPNQTEYTFGTWVPWWFGGGSNGNTAYKSFQGKTDTLGEHTLKMDFGQATPPRPVSVRAQASVQDVNRQSWSANSTLLVHPSAHYVGLKTEKYFVKEGEPLKVDAIVTSIEGEQLAGRPVKVRAARVKYAWRKGKYIEELADEQSCDFETAAGKAHTCTFDTKVGGTYKITATTTDDKGRLNATQLTRWVSGGQVPPARRVELERVTLVPDKEEYQPGDKVKLLVQSPFTPAEGILTIRRHGIVETRRFTMKGSTTTLEVPVLARHIPNLYVQVDLVGSAPRVGNDGKVDASLPRRPAYASGALNVKVPPHQRKLDVALSPAAKALAPGEQTSVDVTVRDAAGKPVEGVEVALVVVDEAILALTGYSMSDPLAFFHAMRPADARDVHLRQYVVLAEPDALKMADRAESDGDGFADEEDGAPRDSLKKERRYKSAARPSPAPAAMAASADAPMAEAAGLGLMGAGRGGGGLNATPPGEAVPNTPIAVRENFNPLAVFAPARATDASGKTTVSYKLPDNLTRYRVMAVAVKGAEQYGHAESNITARLPVMVRPSPPRFLNFGDSFELPVVVQNQTDKPITVQLAARATNVKLASAVGQSVTVPANDRVEVRFPASSQEAGTARFQIGAQAGSFADAQEFKLPVWTPATSEAFATYGVVDSGAVVQPVATPGDVWEQFGGLQITTSSTAMQALTDAFLYLYAYPYECSEQISSRVLSVAALRDVLTAFKAEEMPSQAELKAAMDRDIKKVLSRQSYNGGFGLWRPNQTAWPYVTLHVTHALARAKQKGYTVPDYNIERAKNYLRNVERHIPHYYGEWTRRHIIAYALYVRNLLGDKDPAGARALLKRAGGLKGMSFESLGWLLGVMTGDKASAAELAEIRRHLGNRVTETAGAAHFASSIGADQGYLIMHSDRSADAIILEALIDDQPKSDLIPKIVKGLMAHRKRGRWGNTQENAFVLIALDKYFNTYEKQTPDFVARVWLGDQFAGEHKFKGRTTEEHQIEVPMRYVAKNVQKGGKLYLQKDGKGRMYYRLGMTYAPKNLFLEPAEHGFTVQRVYEPVDNDADVSRRADGTWVIKAGAKVRVKLTMVAPTRRYHVALVDPMPAGLESLNPALAVTGDVPQDTSSSSGGGWWWWSRTWYEHQNMRDERTEAFTSLLWGGVHSYTYYARATTPGEFVVPPAKAEEMYSPETFGRSGSDRVIVKD